MATKWGIVSAGRISHDFVTAVRGSIGDEHKFVAVAARDINSAKEFASRHGIPKVYGSYEDIAKDPDLDVIYIGTITSQHFPVGKLMLEHGKNVLMEKPMTSTLKQTKKLVEIARSNNCFLMEAIWSRFLPSYKHLMDLLEKKTVGDVIHVSANFGQKLLDKEKLLEEYNGGGALLDLGIYNLNVVSMIYNGERPEKIASVGYLNKDGVDLASCSSLLYRNNRTAQVSTSITTSLPGDLVITGTKGHIKVPYNLWCATTIKTDNETFNFPLPDSILPCNFINSSGLHYEAMEVRKCLKEGKLESLVMPLKDSINLAEIMSEIHQQIGATFDGK